VKAPWSGEGKWIQYNRVEVFDSIESLPTRIGKAGAPGVEATLRSGARL